VRNLEIRIKEWLDRVQSEGISVDRLKAAVGLKHGEVVAVRAAADLDRVSVGRVAEIDRLIHIQLVFDHYYRIIKVLNIKDASESHSQTGPGCSDRLGNTSPAPK